MRFKTTIIGTEGTAAGIAVPAAIVEGMGKGKRPPVKVTIAGHTYRSTVAVMGGAFMVGVTNEFRNKSGVAAGDTVDVEIELDTEERTVTVPPELARALDRDPRARAFFERLSYSRKRLHTEPIASAKTDETRQRRLEKSIKELHDGVK
jgi:Bacteriocin-protection, YdeI or OmpD-Associated/Domain of unknown function (DUF1905)